MQIAIVLKCMNKTNTEKRNEIAQERITVYAPQDEYRRFKAKLALKGLAITEWFRRKLKEEITLED